MPKDKKVNPERQPNVQAKLYSSKSGSLVGSYSIMGEKLVIDTHKFEKGKYILHLLENGEIVLNEQLIFK